MESQGRFSHSLEVLRSSTFDPAGVPAELRVPEEDAQSVLLVRAVEEADQDGELLSQAERLRATEASRLESGFPIFVVERARILRESIETRTPAFARMRRASSLRIGALWIVGPALALGLASNLLGPDKHINVVANPLAGLIVWNVAIYVLLLVGLFRRPRVPFAGNLVAWRARGLMSGARMDKGAASSAASYVQGWVASAAALLGARLRRALHIGAASMVVGALGGMYARGLLFEYLPTWESTFLGPQQVDSWLSLFLGPASLVTGIEVPSVQGIGAPGSPNAAGWIHLYAVTTVGLVLVPRILLILGATRQARRLADPITVDARPRYYRRVFASGYGGDLRVDVQPYSYTLTPGRTDVLKTILHDVLGARAQITVAASADYGEGALPPASRAGDPAQVPVEHAIVLLFNLAQTPEIEVHGRLITELEGRANDGDTGLVLIDAAGWRERVGETSASDRRLDERRRTWDRVVRDAGLLAVHVDLDRPVDEDLLVRIEQSLRPADDMGVAS
jgi:hypothetical protein